MAGNFRGKGVLDLAVADMNSDQVSILLNNGNGTFQAPRWYYRVGSTPLALVAGDFNGDQHVDLATANANSYDVSVLLGNGDSDGTFEPQLRFGAGTFPASLVTADFNGDGHLGDGRSTSQPGIRVWPTSPARATSLFFWAEVTARSRTS